jgi:glutaminyl-tRNA synthetase
LLNSLLKSFERVRPGSTKEGYAEDVSNLGSLLMMLATVKPKDLNEDNYLLIEKHIGSGELDIATRVKEALFQAKKAGKAKLVWDELKVSCGVGIVQGEKEVKEALKSFLATHSAVLLEGRYPAANKMRSDFNKLLRWADGKVVTKEWEAGLLEFLGPKDSAENKAAMNKKPEKKKKEAGEGQKKKSDGKKGENKPKAVAEEGSLGLVAGMDHFGRPEDNVQIDKKLLEAHLKATGGKVVTRFPPEPNGYLHMGHALSMARVFGYAEAKGGYCLLRYDDTNPEAEKKEYIDSILNDVKWMGYSPAQVTYSSDNFDKLYAFAEQLISQGDAYVCDLEMEEMREQRRNKVDSPFRNRSIEENMRLFRKMRDGYFEEGSCVLRVKGDMQHDNPNMRDFVAYRIKHMPHPHAGPKWCIYPSYDFTHAICDSLENITHSICTLEFVSRNATYQWLLDKLHVYKPPQLEAQRLNITHVLLSKRKLLHLVKEGYVSGWTDPRMPTLMGVRRKGYPPRALHEFMLAMGVSRSSDGLVPIERLEEFIRNFLNTRAPRAMAVKKPIAVVVDNWEEGKVEKNDVPDFPDDPSRGTHERTFSKNLFISASDWREKDSAKYFGLAPGKRVRLKYGYIIKHVSTDYDKATGKPTILHVEYESDKSGKVKGTLSWLSKQDAVPCELRMLRHLFKSPTPGIEKTPNGDVKRDFLLDLHPNSLNPHTDALVEKRCHGVKVETMFQFERMGYFIVDPDSTGDKTVFNRTVSTKSTKVKF